MRRTTDDFVMHMLRFIDHVQPNRIVYIGLKVLFHAIVYFLPHDMAPAWAKLMGVTGSFGLGE